MNLSPPQKKNNHILSNTIALFKKYVGIFTEKNLANQGSDLNVGIFLSTLNIGTNVNLALF
jgi:hypothetical protein